MEMISSAWPWYVAGPLIALTMFLVLYFGKSLGISGALRVVCAACGAGKNVKFFDFNWKGQRWNLLFVLGNLLGGMLAHNFFPNPEAIDLSEHTLQVLAQIGVEAPSPGHILPESIFSWEGLFTLRGFLILVGGGFLVGFGARYAGGCTSGHAISGLSALQIPSLIAVIGFFVGGLIMTHLLLPLIMAL